MRIHWFPIITLTLLTICIKGTWNDIQIEKREYVNPQSPIDIKKLKPASENKVMTSNAQQENKTTTANIKNATTTSEQTKPKKQKKVNLPKPQQYHNNLYVDETRPKQTGYKDGSDTVKQKTQTVTVPTKKNNDTEREKLEREWRDSVKFKGIGPKGMDFADDDTCDDFSRNARFNPYSVLHDEWFSFYYWAAPCSPRMHLFLPITSQEKQFVRGILDPQVEEPVDWNATMVLFIDLGLNTSGLLVERNDRGMYWFYPIAKDLPQKIKPFDVRFKQTSNNKYLAIMCCQTGDVFVFARKHEIPRKKEIPDVVATIGFRARRGKSYLYQGHEWMPIPERDEVEYWAPESYKQKYFPPEVQEEMDYMTPEELLRS